MCRHVCGHMPDAPVLSGSEGFLARASRLLLTPFKLAPPARAVISDNGLKEVQKGALINGFTLMDLNRPCLVRKMTENHKK